MNTNAFVYKNFILLDGTEEMTPKTDLLLFVKDGKIEKISPVTEELPEGYEVKDLGGKYLMPGLINLHVHLPATGKPKKKASDPKKLVKILTSNALFRLIVRKMCEKSAKTQLLSGVTTVRTVGGVLRVDGDIRDRINEGKTTGPRLLVSNMALSVPGGHMADSLALAAENAEEAKEYTETILAGNPDLLKLMITGGVLDAKVKGEPGEMKMPEEYIKIACDLAHEKGIPVAAHVESPAGVRAALVGGVDTIEHGALPDDEIISLFKEKGAAHVATLSPALPYARFDRSVSHISEMEQYNGDVVFRGIVDCAKACLAAGVPVGLGTDTGCPFITHYDMWREVNYFVKYCDVTPAFALHTATEVNAKIARIDDVTGTVAEGKSADFLITKDNPLDAISALRTPTAVVIRGRFIDAPNVKKMKNVETALDAFV